MRKKRRKNRREKKKNEEKKGEEKKIEEKRKKKKGLREREKACIYIIKICSRIPLTLKLTLL